MKLTRAAVLFTTLAVTGVLVAAAVQDKKEAVLISADQAKFKDVVPGVSRAVLRGDPDKGAYAAFTKFAPGTSNALHSHTSELRIVVLKGAYLYKPENGEEKRVGAGSYFSIPGGERHVSTADAKEGALFYEESPGKFDLVMVEVK